MIVVSYLVKDLICDWRLGESHFMAHLVDGEQQQARFKALYAGLRQPLPPG